MKYVEKIEKRQSIREYRKKELTQEQIDQITAYLPDARRLFPEIELELKIAGDTAKNRLEGIVGYGGNAFGAPDYLILLSEHKDYYLENAGYVMEDLILKLTDMGLDSCWLSVNGNSDIIKKALNIAGDKEVAAVAAVGNGKAERALKRLDIINPSNINFNERAGHVAPKIAQDDIAFYGVWGNPVDWDENRIPPQVDRAVYAASLAPSFLNRQPYRFMFSNKILILLAQKEEMVADADTKLDVGAAMLNFAAVMDELNGTGGPWKMGIPDGLGDTKKPDEYEIISYYDLTA